jgi:hypothetical protein
MPRTLRDFLLSFCPAKLFGLNLRKGHSMLQPGADWRSFFWLHWFLLFS